MAGINFFCLLFFYISAIKENNSSSVAGLKNTSVGVAGIICILELIVASVLGFIVFSDPVNIWSILGIVIVIASLIFIELEEKILEKFEGVKNNARL